MKMVNLLKKNSFDKKYPLLVKYIIDDDVRQNMLNNNDLARKYEATKSSIQIFLFELEKRFDSQTIANIIMETIFKYPDEMLLSFITAYLNSDEPTKSNLEIVSFYNKTASLGLKALKYIENHGIIANRHYKELPSMIIDELYEQLKTGEETFKDEFLDKCYPNLAINEKQLVVELLENKAFHLLDKIFKTFSSNLSNLLKILVASRIDTKIINNEVFEHIDTDVLTGIIYMLISIEEINNILLSIQNLFKAGRYQLLENIVYQDKFYELDKFTNEDLNNLKDEEIMQKLHIEPLSLIKKEDLAA